ncbi:MAG: hypothetical protein ACJ75R_05175 [Solirubrobacterales bacterium]
MILTLAAAIPVVVPLVALGLLAAGIALPILLVRSLGRPAMRAPRPSAPAVRGHRLHSSAR